MLVSLVSVPVEYLKAACSKDMRHSMSSSIWAMAKLMHKERCANDTNVLTNDFYTMSVVDKVMHI